MRSTHRAHHPISGGKQNHLRMNNHIRLAAMLVIVAAFAVLAARCGSKKKAATSATSSSGGNTAVGSGTYDNGSSKKGGIYTIGWEHSFGFKDQFHPTGEYLDHARAPYSNPIHRS